jgi:hypothetical protein
LEQQNKGSRRKKKQTLSKVGNNNAASSTSLSSSSSPGSAPAASPLFATLAWKFLSPAPKPLKGTHLLGPKRAKSAGDVFGNFSEDALGWSKESTTTLQTPLLKQNGELSGSAKKRGVNSNISKFGAASSASVNSSNNNSTNGNVGAAAVTPSRRRHIKNINKRIGEGVMSIWNWSIVKFVVRRLKSDTSSK